MKRMSSNRLWKLSEIKDRQRSGSSLRATFVGLSLSLSLMVGSAWIQPHTASAATAASVTADATTLSAEATSTTRADRLVATAKSYLGKVKYRYGTRDTKRLILDCSAFTQLVFSKNGISIPWGSKAQTSVGTKVTSKSKLVKGDLVMFSTSTPGKINHVGIYIGSGKFISNTTSSGVAINSIYTGYWGSRFIQGRHLK